MDSEATQPPKSTNQKILDALNRGEGIAARSAAAIASKLAQYPHAALVVALVWTAVVAWVGYKVGHA